MRFVLDRSSSTPLYRQVYESLRAEILSGVLLPHAPLPSSRELAATLGVNRVTVTTAYAELEADGLICSKQGSGTYVAPPLVSGPAKNRGGPVKDWPLWQQELPSRSPIPAQRELSSMIAALASPGVISFAAGLGDSTLFPAEDFRRVLQGVLRREGQEALGYGDQAGYLPLRTTIAQILGSQGLHARPAEILITSGAQQALAPVSRLLLRPGDVVLAESPTYPSAIDLFRSLNVRMAGLSVDEFGMQVEQLEEVLEMTQARLIYTMPTFQNPTGACMSLARRRQLVGLADRYNIPILEDEFVGDLRFEGRPLPSLAALDPGGRVILMGTFSKMLMPGLRVGYLVASGPVYDHLLDCKRVDDLASSNLIQRALDAYITVGRYHAHLRRACRLYRKRRDAMVYALRRHLPVDARWLVPQGGLFIWLVLPAGMTGDELLPIAAAEGVLFAPGSLFFAGSRAQPYVRLNYAEHSPETIEEGIRRLGRAIARCRVERTGAVSRSEVLERPHVTVR